jgi:LuxR family maltose regulon positive regulatory protein
MSILTTKLHIPPLRSKHVLRPRLIERLNDGAQRKLTLVSAPAGFGKTTLVSEWIAQSERLTAWLSLDEDDNDPARFMSYLIAALQRIQPEIGQGVFPMLQTPRPPIEAALTTLLNEIDKISDPFTLVLDDYHVITAQAIDQALTFLLEHSPPQMGMVIVTREDPSLPLHKLRAQDQLTELRAADLRFTRAEAAIFLARVMGLKLSAEDIAALEARTEGWIVGLQLAAISMQGVPDKTVFIQSFAGSHHYILDYLLEEVLHKQPERVQHFLLHTSILNRMCGSLCDALLDAPAPSGQKTLETLEQANLFIIPLDNERRWYRYHHLFADLLRQRLPHSIAASAQYANSRINELHIRASQWYEDDGLDIEAFHHAAAANDIERAERLMDGRGIPLHLRGAVTAILDWLATLPTTVMNAKPSLWWRYGAMLLVVGQTTGVEEKLDAAEAALQAQGAEADNRLLIGRIAVARAVLALTRYQAETMITQSRRALEYLPHDNLPLRANAYWTLGVAYLYQKDRAAARQSLTEAISLSQAAGDVFTTILATIGLGNVQEADNQLHQAAETFQQVLQLAGDQPLQIIYDAHLGLARVLYEWNDLDAAQKYGEQSLQLARQYDKVIDRFIVCEVFLARLKLARGDVAEAAATLAQTYHTARQKNFVHRIPEVAAAQAPVLLRQGRHAEALHLAQTHALPLSEALVYLAQGDASTALALLDGLRQQAEARGWADERLNIMTLQAVAQHMQGERDKALERLDEALALAEPEGFIRLFVDKGPPMAHLLAETAAQGMRPDYVGKLMAAFDAEPKTGESISSPSLSEPLSQRELEVLRLIEQGLSNSEISERLFLALDTVKGHNRRIFEKLGVQRRTEAVAQARKLGLL